MPIAVEIPNGHVPGILAYGIVLRTAEGPGFQRSFHCQRQCDVIALRQLEGVVVGEVLRAAQNGQTGGATREGDGGGVDVLGVRKHVVGGGRQETLFLNSRIQEDLHFVSAGAGQARHVGSINTSRRCGRRLDDDRLPGPARRRAQRHTGRIEKLHRTAERRIQWPQHDGDGLVWVEVEREAIGIARWRQEAAHGGRVDHRPVGRLPLPWRSHGEALRQRLAAIASQVGDRAFDHAYVVVCVSACQVGNIEGHRVAVYRNEPVGGLAVDRQVIAGHRREQNRRGELNHHRLREGRQR